MFAFAASPPPMTGGGSLIPNPYYSRVTVQQLPRLAPLPHPRRKKKKTKTKKKKKKMKMKMKMKKKSKTWKTRNTSRSSR